MIISISRLTKFFSFGFLLFTSFFSVNVYADNAIKSVSILVGKHKTLERYNLHLDSAPDFVNVKINFKIGKEDNQRLTLEVFPIVGVTRWGETEGITDLKYLEKTKQSLNSFYTFNKIVGHDQTECIFDGINIGAIISYYSSKQLWPIQIIFKATLSPSAKEQDIKNNVKEIVLPVDPAD